MTYC